MSQFHTERDKLRAQILALRSDDQRGAAAEAELQALIQQLRLLLWGA